MMFNQYQCGRMSVSRLISVACGSIRWPSGRASRAWRKSSSIRPPRPKPLDERWSAALDDVAAKIRAARRRKAAVMLIYGAHLVKNGAARIVNALMAQGWLTHLATNGAGTIHDWEFAWLGRSTESVRDGVARGCFGTWDETGRNIHVALLAAGVAGEGYGRALGQFIAEDGVTLPEPADLEDDIRREPAHPLTAARAELLAAMREHGLPAGRYTTPHRWKEASILAAAFRHGVPITVHPGIGYDIIATHPMFNGAAIGRAAQRDFAQFTQRRGTTRRRRRALGRLGHHGSAGLREEPELRQQSPPPGRKADRRRPHDLRRRPPGRRRLGLDRGRTAEDQPGLLSPLLQELLPHGREPCTICNATT